MHNQTTATKLPARLIEQVDTVDNKIEFGDYPISLKIVSQVVNVIESQCRLAAALGMPNNAFTDSAFNLTLDCLGRKYLRIAHDMLF